MGPVSKFKIFHMALLCVLRVARPMGGNSSRMCGWACGRLHLCKNPNIAMSRRSAKGAKLNCKNATSTSMFNACTNDVASRSRGARTV